MCNPEQQNTCKPTIQNVAAAKAPKPVLYFSYEVRTQPFDVAVEFEYDSEAKQLSFYIWMCNKDNTRRDFIGEGMAKCETEEEKEHIQIINAVMLYEETLSALEHMATCNGVCEPTASDMTCIETNERTLMLAYCLGSECADIMVQYFYNEEEEEINLTVWLYGRDEDDTDCYKKIGSVDIPCTSDNPEEHTCMVMDYMQSQPTLCHIANNAWDLEFDCNNCEWECVCFDDCDDCDCRDDCDCCSDDCCDNAGSCDGPGDCASCGERNECECCCMDAEE